MSSTPAPTVAGTVRMSNGTRRVARAVPGAGIQFATFANANANSGRGWRNANIKQAATFVPDVIR
jgi:hypothetical protein